MSFLNELENEKTANATSRFFIGGVYWTTVAVAAVALAVGCGLIFAHYANLAYRFDMTTSAWNVGVFALLFAVVTTAIGYWAIVLTAQGLFERLAKEKNQEFGEVCWRVVKTFRYNPARVPVDVARAGLLFGKSILPTSIFGTEDEKKALLAQNTDYNAIKASFLAAGHRVPK